DAVDFVAADDRQVGHTNASFAPFVELMTDEKMPWAHVPAVHSYSRYPESLDELQALMDDYANL
ncbi:MAG: hypothetical protein P8X50_15870, partial [Maritimibacter sp.]